MRRLVRALGFKSSPTAQPDESEDISPAVSTSLSACTEGWSNTVELQESAQVDLHKSINKQALKKNRIASLLRPQTSQHGLSVVYTPPTTPHRANIIFIHGLGGTSLGTWTKSKDPELFWPSKFLQCDPELCSCRILTFGYEASIFKGDNIKSISDIAKDLLFNLKYSKDENGEDLEIAEVN